MTYLIAACGLCLLSVRALNHAHKIYVEQKGLKAKLTSLVFAIIGVAAVIFSYQATDEFKIWMGW